MVVTKKKSLKTAITFPESFFLKVVTFCAFATNFRISDE
jgi:hypothetical protein